MLKFWIASGLVMTSSIGVAQSSEKEPERMQVTGSRIKRMDMEGSSPITVIDRQAIEVSGAQTITDILKTLPAIVGNSVTTTTTNGGGGGAGNITLRGLPATATLVLLNGRRLPNDGLTGETPDLNAIPVSAIERMEVLKDGASAVYGSDAIAGVVNIITKRDYEGVSTDIYSGMASAGDLKTSSVGVTYGSAGDKGSMMIGVNLFRQGNIRSADREVSEVPLTGGSSAIPNGAAYIATGSGGFTCSDGAASCGVTVNDGVSSPSSAADFRELTAADRYNYAAETDSAMAQERRSLYLTGTYDITDSLRANITSTYTNTYSEFQSAPTPIFLSNETGSLTVAADNIYNPFGVALTDVRKRMTDLSPRQNQFDSDVSSLVVGLDGDLGDTGWSWNVDVNFGNTQTIETAGNILSKSNLAASIGSPVVCNGLASLGCVPVNLLAPAGSLSAAEKSWLTTEANIRGQAATESVSLNFGGELGSLPGGPIALAAGVEVRAEEIKFRPDGQTAGYNSIGNTNFKATQGDREINELYVEALMPVLKSFDVELAARSSNYSDFGSTVNPKAGLKFKPTNDFTIRGTYSTGFRAPSLRELYKGEAENFAFLTDPCSSDASQCNGGVQSDSSIFQFLALEGGNEDLDPEESKSFTFGLAYASTFGLNVKVDYFNVETENAIATNAQYVLDQYRKNGLFADQVTVDANNNVSTIKAIALNLAARKVKGVDFGVDYTKSVGVGNRITLALSGTKFLEYLNQADKSSEFEDVVGKFVDDASDGRGSIPEMKLNFGLGYGIGDLVLNLTSNYVSGLETDGDDADLDAWLTHDLQVAYTLNSFNSTVTVGMDNITDEEPPSTRAAFNDNIDARTHSLVGRYYYLSMTSNF